MRRGDNPELVGQAKNCSSGPRQISDSAKSSKVQKTPTEPKGTSHSTRGSDIQKAPSGHTGVPSGPMGVSTRPKGASNRPKGISTSARGPETQNFPSGPRGTRMVLRGPERAHGTTKTQKAPRIPENEPYLPPKAHKIREVTLVRTNSVITLKVTRHF